ncbi:MAG: hypothetical protein MOGDAGHF_02128 [Rhodocyclaceae bacterium]|nr:hypothetical protein [Rhodocyclaceae bacterium]
MSPIAAWLPSAFRSQARRPRTSAGMAPVGTSGTMRMAEVSPPPPSGQWVTQSAHSGPRHFSSRVYTGTSLP